MSVCFLYILFENNYSITWRNWEMIIANKHMLIDSKIKFAQTQMTKPVLAHDLFGPDC